MNSTSGARIARRAPQRSPAQGQPLRPRHDRAEHRHKRCAHLFSGARRSRSSGGGAGRSEQRAAHPRMGWNSSSRSASSMRSMSRSRRRRSPPSTPSIPPLAAATAAERRCARDLCSGSTPNRCSIEIDSSLDAADAAAGDRRHAVASCSAAVRTSREPKRSCGRPTPISPWPAPRSFRASI